MPPDQDNFPVNPTPLEHEAYGWVARFISGELVQPRSRL